MNTEANTDMLSNGVRNVLHRSFSISEDFSFKGKDKAKTKCVCQGKD